VCVLFIYFFWSKDNLTIDFVLCFVRCFVVFVWQLHKACLASYDEVRQLAWAPRPQLVMLCAHFFHAADPRISPVETAAAAADEEDEGGERQGSDAPERLAAPLEAHIKAVLYNPHTRSRRQASAVFDFLAAGQGDLSAAAAAAAGAGGGAGGSGSAAAVACAAASAKYFFDAVKQKNGLGKLLEIAMTSLQLSFTNSVHTK
jgi:hypothetical protein